MPPRLVSVGLLLYWAVAALSLITHDLLPEWTVGSPPDLRTISRAEEGARPGRWAVQVLDDPRAPEVRRTVGQAMTEGVRRPDGSVVMASRVWFDAGGVLKGTPFDNKADARIEVGSTYLVDPSGNLKSLRARVRSVNDPEELFDIQGDVKNHAVTITTHGPIALLNQTRSIPYEPRGVVQNALGPVDRLPGLQVGQRWDTRVVNPFTGRADVARVEVTRRVLIHWNNNPVTVLEVVQHLTPITARTWVRADGLVLRQEVPFPFVRLVLERLPDGPGSNQPEVAPR
jgi:hypothetical protein